LAEKLLSQFKNALGEVTLVPSSGGAFEISVDDELIYSKLETGRFPSEDAVIRDVGAKL